MVRRLIAAVSLALALCVSMASQATAYTVYDGSLGSNYITYFRDIISKYPVSSDYVAFRSGQYDYMLVIGDLTKTDSRIASDGEVAICTVSTNTGYNANTAINFRNESSFDLDVGDDIVYSNLGLYPALEGRSDVYDFTTCYLLIVVFICVLLRGIIDWRAGRCS